MGTLHTTRAIVLRTFRHGDSSVVLKAYTEAFGTRSYMVRPSKRGAVRPAHLQPLARLELVVSESGERDLQRLLEARLFDTYNGAAGDQARAMILFFAQEVFYRTLKEETPDPALFNDVLLLLEEIDTGDRPGRLPLLLLARLARHLGILPELPHPDEDRFDMQDGRFFSGSPPHAFCMDPRIASAFASLLHSELHGSEMPLDAAVRRDLLDQVLIYYRMHIEGFGQLRSLDVLHALLH